MFRRAAVPLIAVSLVVTLPASSAAQNSDQLEGAWVIEKIETSDGDVIDSPNRMLVLFVDGYFSELGLFANPDTFATAGEPTEEEKLAYYDALFAHAGEYEMRGDTILSRAFVSHSPNRAAAWPDSANRNVIRVEGDRAYFDTGANVFTLRRVNGRPLPR